MRLILFIAVIFILSTIGLSACVNSVRVDNQEFSSVYKKSVYADTNGMAMFRVPSSHGFYIYFPSKVTNYTWDFVQESKPLFNNIGITDNYMYILTKLSNNGRNINLQIFLDTGKEYKLILEPYEVPDDTHYAILDPVPVISNAVEEISLNVPYNIITTIDMPYVISTYTKETASTNIKVGQAGRNLVVKTDRKAIILVNLINNSSYRLTISPDKSVTNTYFKMVFSK